MAQRAPMTKEEVVKRALGAIGQGCIYKLGAGGMKPSSPVPWNAKMGCDCSGFAMWALGLSRFQPPRWFDTTAIVSDALNELGLFTQVVITEAQPGDLFVWGDSGGSQGHVGVITQCMPGLKSTPTFVVHCSSGNFRRTGDAIRQTPADLFFHHDAIVARCELIQAGTRLAGEVA